MQKKILVTGASGFIGRHTLPLLVNKGYKVYATSLSGNVHSLPGVTTVACDLLKLSEATDLLDKVRPSHLLHLAWYTKHGSLWEAVENIDWVKASLHLVQEFARFGGARAVIAGSCAEYTWSYDIFNEETTPCEPSSLYGKSKNCLRILLEDLCKKKSISMSWGRVFFMYGPNEDPKKLVASMIISMLQGQDFFLQNENLIRDFMHVQDVAAAFVELAENQVEGIFNIASGEGVSLKKLGSIVERILDKRSLLKITQTDHSFLGSSKIVADVLKMQRSLHWKPTYSLEDGLQDSVLWWQKNLPI